MRAQPTDNETIRIFVPVQLKKRSGVAMIMVPADAEEDNERYYDETLIKAFARAYHWKQCIKSGKYMSVQHICDKERIGIDYARQLYRLNLVAPFIIEAIINGTQPRTLCLQDFMRSPIPLLWDEQLARFGFKAATQESNCKRSTESVSAIGQSEDAALSVLARVNEVKGSNQQKESVSC